MANSNNVAIAMSTLEKIGAKGETLRLDRSRCLTFDSKTHSKDLKTWKGVIQGRDGTYSPMIIIGKGYTCTCLDHQNLLDGTRKCGYQTGRNYTISPCKHILSLARFAWVALRDMK